MLGARMTVMLASFVTLGNAVRKKNDLSISSMTRPPSMNLPTLKVASLRRTVAVAWEMNNSIVQLSCISSMKRRLLPKGCNHRV